MIPTNSLGKLSCGEIFIIMLTLVCQLLYYIGPDISGEMILQQTVDVSEVQLPQTIKTDKISHPIGLKSRWKPFGWSK